MKLSGRIILESKTIKRAIIENMDTSLSFRDKLEFCLVELCRVLDIPVPLWLGKNTTELGGFHKTFFSREQFVEDVKFDKFEIQLV